MGHWVKLLFILDHPSISSLASVGKDSQEVNIESKHRARKVTNSFAKNVGNLFQGRVV